MSITTCPECRHEVTVPDRYVGRWWRCPDCRTGFRPPSEEEEHGGHGSHADAPAPGAVKRALARFMSMLTGR